MSNSYLEKYQHLIQNGKAYGAEPEPNQEPHQDPFGSPDPFGGDYDPEASWDEWGAEDFDPFGEDPFEDGFSPDDVQEESSDWDPLAHVSDPIQKTQPPSELSDKDRRKIERVQDLYERAGNEYQELQAEYQKLTNGKGDLEGRKEQLNRVEEELKDVEKFLEKAEDKSEELSNDGINVNSTEGTASNEELFGDTGALMESIETNDEIDQDLNQEVEIIKEEIKAEAEEINNQIKAKEIKEQMAEIEKDNEEHKEDVKYGFMHAKEFLNGSVGVQYGTAKVWGKKHIKEFYENPNDDAGLVFDALANGAETGDWSGVITQVESLSASNVDNALGLVYVILKNHHPQLMEEIPSDVLEKFHKNIMQRGNNPKGSSIVMVAKDREKFDGGDFAHVFFSGGWSAFDIRDADGNKVWKLDDDRRRELKKVGTSYAEAAAAFKSQANANKLADASKEKDLEDLQKQLDALTQGADWAYHEDYNDDEDSGYEVDSEKDSLPPEEDTDDPEAAA